MEKNHAKNGGSYHEEEYLILTRPRGKFFLIWEEVLENFGLTSRHIEIPKVEKFNQRELDLRRN